MRFLNLYFAVLAALLGVALAADSIHVPLRKRSHGGLRLVERDGTVSDVVNMDALRRSINKLNNRYAEDEDDESLQKRWVSPAVLTKEVDYKLAHDDDVIQNNLLKSLGKTLKNILPVVPSPSDAIETISNQAQAKSKSRVLRESKGRYSGASGPNTADIDLKVATAGDTDIEFVGDISIGTPPQKFPINPDTGSADLWVVDSTCTDVTCGPNSRGKFQKSKSSSYEGISSPKFDLQYGIGGVSGSYARETVYFGDSITLKKQTIGLANKTSDDWEDDLASGVLGLGFRSITSNDQRPIIQNLASQAGLKKKVISFAFGRFLSNTQDKSEMRIGAVNRNLYKGTTSYYNLTRAAYWQVKIKSFAAKGGLGVAKVDGIIDTGTSLIAAPPALAALFWKDVPGSRVSNDGSYYTYPCSNKINAAITMPDGRAFKISELDISLGKLTSGSTLCVGSVVVANTPGQVIYGLSALKNFYSVFDFGKNRLGMATYNF